MWHSFAKKKNHGRKRASVWVGRGRGSFLFKGARGIAFHYFKERWPGRQPLLEV